jgi:hypothetical protein
MTLTPPLQFQITSVERSAERAGLYAGRHPSAVFDAVGAIEIDEPLIPLAIPLPVNTNPCFAPCIATNKAE